MTTPRARKASNPLLLQEKKPSELVPALVDEGTRAWNIAKMIQKGKTIHEIMEDYGLSQVTIEKAMREAVAQIHEQAAPIILNWVSITINRTEHMLSLLYDQLTDDDGHVNDSIFSRMQQIITQQMEVINLLTKNAGKEKGGDTFNFHQTIVSGGNLYAEANKAIAQTRTGLKSEREEEISDLDNPFGEDVIVFPKS